ncbi:Uncharacterised protein [Burkholderia oklahomensis]|nr:hypothetical protein BG90_6057 [Burkholderia oklahomensis C6786]SUY29022.1 Uncharacterised protein [Burkholderia oklahomensis]
MCANVRSFANGDTIHRIVSPFALRRTLRVRSLVRQSSAAADDPRIAISIQRIHTIDEMRDRTCRERTTGARPDMTIATRPPADGDGDGDGYQPNFNSAPT